MSKKRKTECILNFQLLLLFKLAIDDGVCKSCRVKLETFIGIASSYITISRRTYCIQTQTVYCSTLV